ncbi:oxygen-dependent tRNA uridine(34) hydroxylase TrhO [Rhizorhapis sp. SPR117]|uniref:oxygen-dependent tRNA uridine(34) hydroxylase TrhO n=1 Tax=Rhizorhapis sp. SPR117 TaxID=2912611 RepID=UPI001F3EDBBB|nr:rhodanese-related sulfurtransferase [Rhizorhapis sp. SPR117]
MTAPPVPASVMVAALYRFARFDDPAALRAPLQAVCDAAGVKGTLLLAHEGINGTIAGEDNALAAVIAHIRTLSGCADLDVKYSAASDMPFYRMKVRIKREIVTMGAGELDPVTNAGTYVEPRNWNALISDPDTILIDTRNGYEVAIGSFEGAIDPQTTSFGEFPAWFDTYAQKLEQGKQPKIAMFCTGGIRCEKSTAFVKSRGFENVYHLKGGILKYLETVDQEDSKWRGECFVFDQRVAVGHGLAEGEYGLCHACRMPLSPQDRASPLYVEGVSCPHCHDERDEAQRARYRERQRQIEAAQARGEAHIGAAPGTKA